MTLDQLRYAVEVMKTKQFSRAAENCFISQPSLSVQIANLEAELGYKLFVRSRQGIEVTEAGHELLSQAQSVLDQANQLKVMAAEMKGEIKGHLRLGIIPSAGSSLLPLFLKHFMEAYPDVELSVTEEPTQQLVQHIDAGTLDCAILSTPQRCPASLVEKPLFYEPFMVFASKNHPVLDHRHASVSELSSTEILLLDEAHCLRDQVLQLCKSKAAQDKRRLRIESASLQTLIDVIRKWEGYTLLPALATGMLTANEINKNLRSFEKPCPARKISLVYHHVRNKKQLANALANCIADVLPDDVFAPSKKTGVRVLSPAPEYFSL